MRDPTQNIIDALQILLDNMYYNGTKYPVIDTLPEAKSFNHIWIKGISGNTNDSTKDKNIHDIVIDMEVVSGGFAQKGSVKDINNVSDLILKVIQGLSINEFKVIIPPRLTNYNYIEERAQQDNQTIIIERKMLRLTTKISES